MVRIIVAGTRTFSDKQLVFKTLSNLIVDLIEDNSIKTGYRGWNECIEEICGCATGADSLGREWAELKRVPIKEFPAHWKDFADPCIIKSGKFGKYNALAGFKRNKEMADYAAASHQGILVAFWDNKSRGTKSMIDLANKNHLKVIVVNI